MNPALLGFLLYLITILLVAVYSMKRMKSMDDFLLGGRKLGPFVVALSERASGESAWLVLGLPGIALAVGLLEIWTVIGCVTGIAASWWLVARRLRQLSGDTGALTLAELFQRTLAAEDERMATLLRVSASLIITFIFVFYVSAQFLGAGKVLHQTLDLAPFTGMLIGALLIVVYTLLGGFLAVAWTDVIQGLIMFATLVLLPIVGIHELGGWSVFQEKLLVARSADGGNLLLDLTGGKSGAAAAAAVIGGLSWGLGYLGQPHLLVRYMSIRSASEIRTGRKIALFWAIPAFFGALLLGLVGAVLYGMPAGGDQEMIMPLMAMQLLPAWLAGIFMSGAIAAMMSTADSQLLVASSSLAEDLARGAMKEQPDAGSMLRLGRLFTLIVGLFAFLLAAVSEDLVWTMVSFAWAGLGASFGPLLIFLLFNFPLSARSALVAMWTGTLSTIIWKLVPALSGLITERVASFVLATIVLLVLMPAGSRRAPARLLTD